MNSDDLQSQKRRIKASKPKQKAPTVDKEPQKPPVNFKPKPIKDVKASDDKNLPVTEKVFHCKI